MWRKTQWHPENLNSRPLSSVPMLVQNLGSSLGEAWNQVPYTEVKERRTKVVDHCRLVGGSFDKQGNLQGLCWAATVPDRSLHLPTGTLKVFVAALTGSVMYAVQMVWTEPISRLCPWDSFWRGKASRMHIPRTGEGMKAFDCLGAAGRSCPLDDLLKDYSSWLALSILHTPPPPPPSTICQEQGVSLAWRRLMGSSLVALEADTIATT